MLCPKCHRPVEGDEVYVCCADAPLEWRCESCGKVSEGFAFPYGTCPACSGILKLQDPRTLDTTSAHEAIRVAFELELGGMAFYTRAALDAQDPVLKNLFQKLATMETEHMATLARRYHADVLPPSEAFQIERAAIYAGITRHPEDPINLFEIAIAAEERTARFFAERSAKAKEGSPEARLYQELAAEEQEHVALLTLELERYRQGKPGLL